jgi:hypothetical protein
MITIIMLHLACLKTDKKDIGHFNCLNQVGKYRNRINEKRNGV